MTGIYAKTTRDCLLIYYDLCYIKATTGRESDGISKTEMQHPQWQQKILSFKKCNRSVLQSCNDWKHSLKLILSSTVTSEFILLS